MAFCDLLNGRSDFGARWRWTLPSEAQWEYACRAGSEEAFGIADPNGKFGINYLSSMLANFNGGFPYGGGAKRPYPSRTTEVGAYGANAWGFYDMHGNVGEWCGDWYGAYDTRNLHNPMGPHVGNDRVFRGGSWKRLGSSCRSSCRFREDPNFRSIDLGFRPALIQDDAD